MLSDARNDAIVEKAHVLLEDVGIEVENDETIALCLARGCTQGDDRRPPGAREEGVWRRLNASACDETEQDDNRSADL